MRSFARAAVVAACLSCSSSPKPATAPPAAPEPAEPVAAAPSAPSATAAPAAPAKVMSGDTPWQDSDGNTFIVPDGWSVATHDAVTVVTTPEGDSRIALVDVAAASHDAARDAAWKLYKPDAKWPMLNTNDVPARDGWGGGKAYDYQTSPNEKRIIQVGVRPANQR